MPRIPKERFQTKMESNYAMNTGKTTATIVEEDYEDSKTHISVSCSICRHQWNPLPCSLYRHSCPNWRNHNKYHSEEEDTISDKNREINDEIASHADIDLEESRIPYDELSFEQKNIHSFIYVLIMSNPHTINRPFIKIGITMNLRRRINEIRRESQLEVIFHAAKPIKYGRAYLMEKVLKKRLSSYQIDSKKDFRGKTECFSLNHQVIDMLLKKRIIRIPNPIPSGLKNIKTKEVINWFSLPIDV